MGIRYLIGLDLGRDVDHTAWAALEVREYYWLNGRGKHILEYPGDGAVDWEKCKTDIGLIGLSQVPLHTPWGTIAKELEGLIDRCLDRDDRHVEVEVWIDATGIGGPVIEGFFEPVVYSYAQCIMRAVKITPGEAGYEPSAGTVSKVHLIDNAWVIREQRSLRVAKDLENSQVMELFEQQIQDFRRKQGKRAGTLIYEAETLHDDLVIAFSLACLGLDESGKPHIWRL